MPFPGGKSLNGVFQWIINQIPIHDVYIEPFLGSGSILRKKKLAPRSFGIDKSLNVLQLWRDNEFPSLELHCCDAVDWLKFHFGLFRLDVERAANPKRDSQYRTFVYLDPPYLNSTRKSGRSPYDVDFSEEDHDRLLDLIRVIPANVMISGYESPKYMAALSDWRISTLKVSTRGNSEATECLWMNYANPEQLHDYSFIGNDKRERERIRRKLRSVGRKIERLTQFERRALSQRIDQDFVNRSDIPEGM